jgi:hypothetical protein
MYTTVKIFFKKNNHISSAYTNLIFYIYYRVRGIILYIYIYIYIYIYVHFYLKIMNIYIECFL